MQRAPQTRPCRPRCSTLAPLALALSLAFAGSSAQAQTGVTPPGAAEALLEISIPAQPLGDALNAWARQTGRQIAVQQPLVAGKTAPAVFGRLTAQQALERLLVGSGLVSVVEGNTVLLRAAPATAGATAETALPEVRVRASAEALPGELPKPYAGGQVARGGRLGLLGNRDIFETPFSQNSYTEQLIRDQQARTVIDVVENDPSVRSIATRYGGNDQFFIRGFPIFSGNFGFDGLYGLDAARQGQLANIERVEVLRGPTGLINNISTLASVGGAINLVPKRAGDAPLTRIGGQYVV